MVNYEKVCPMCGNEFITHRKDKVCCSRICTNRYNYHSYKEKRKEYMRKYRKTEGRKKSDKKYRDRTIKFKGKSIDVGFNPRTGICSLHDIINHPKPYKTQIHHYKYDEDNRLAYTFELCINCHLNIVHANGYEKLTLEELIEVLKNGN